MKRIFRLDRYELQHDFTQKQNVETDTNKITELTTLKFRNRIWFLFQARMGLFSDGFVSLLLFVSILSSRNEYCHIFRNQKYGFFDIACMTCKFTLFNVI